MKQKVFAIRDRAADVFDRPFFVPTFALAERGFADEINRNEPSNPLAKHPEDYDLYYLGEYDDQTGSFEQEGPPKQVSIGKDCVKPS